MGKIFFYVFVLVYFWSPVVLATAPHLEWSSDEPASYRVYLSQVPNARLNATQVVDMGSELSAYLPELEPGAIVWVQVTAVRYGLESPASNELGYVKPIIGITSAPGVARFFFYRPPEVQNGLRYTLQVTDDFKTWRDELPVEPQISVREDGAEVFILDVPMEAARLFARIKVSPVPEPETLQGEVK